MDDLHFGVHQDMMYALAAPPVPGAQWTGVVTRIAIEMLESGQVEAVVCVQSDERDRFTPKPVRLAAFPGMGAPLLDLITPPARPGSCPALTAPLCAAA